jgi:hypothetical protein
MGVAHRLPARTERQSNRTRKATGHASSPIAHFSLVKALLWVQPHLARAVILADVSHGAQTDVASCTSYQGAC